MMNTYELLVLFAEDTTEEAQKSMIDAIKATIEKNKGTLKDSESWGKKSLAFAIDKNKSGFYWLLDCEGPSQLPKKINDQLRIEDSVLRFLIDRIEGKKKITKPLKKVETKKKLTETFIR